MCTTEAIALPVMNAYCFALDDLPETTDSSIGQLRGTVMGSLGERLPFECHHLNTSR